MFPQCSYPTNKLSFGFSIENQWPNVFGQHSLM